MRILGSYVKRRNFLVCALLPLVSPAIGQNLRKRLIGVIRTGRPAQDTDVQIAGVLRALREYGYVDGVNVDVVTRYAEGSSAQLRETVATLLNEAPDLLVTIGMTVTLAAQEATKTTPIVAFANVDPVAAGLVSQIGRPAGNVTGVLIAPEGSLAAKRLFLLREMVPHVRRFALLAPGSDPAFKLQIEETQAAAATTGIDLTVIDDAGGEYAAAFQRMSTAGIGGVIVGAHQFYVRDRQEIITLAERHRLPAIFEWNQQVEDGGLMSYGANINERYSRLAQHVDRILKGARPADLPFEQPAKLRLVLNLRAARAIQLDVPAYLIVHADEVIE